MARRDIWSPWAWAGPRASSWWHHRCEGLALDLRKYHTYRRTLAPLLTAGHPKKNLQFAYQCLCQWLNLPLGWLTLGLMFLFLHIDAPKPLTVSQGLKRVDWVGNLLLIGSVVSILIALSWADSKYPWGPWHILVPLILGVVALGEFHVFEASSFCSNPTFPPRLFGHRTAVVAYAIIFFTGALPVWRMYFITVYFEGVLLASTARAGVLLL